MKRALMVMLLGVVMPISPLAQGAPRNPGVNMLDAIAAGPTDPKEFEAWMDQFLADYLKRSSVSLGFVLVKDGKIFFQKGYGYADAEKKTPVVPDQTLFYAASVSKLTITRSRTYFTRLVGLVADTHVVSNGDGTLTLRLPPLGSKSLRMVEVEPLLFRAEGGFYINFGEDGKGNITRMFTSGSIKDPTAYDRLRWYESGLLHAGLGAAGFLIFLSFPVVSAIGFIRGRWRKARSERQSATGGPHLAWRMATLVSLLVVFAPLPVMTWMLFGDHSRPSQFRAAFHISSDSLLLAAVLGFTLSIFAGVAWTRRLDHCAADLL